MKPVFFSSKIVRYWSFLWFELNIRLGTRSLFFASLYCIFTPFTESGFVVFVTFMVGKATT